MKRKKYYYNHPFPIDTMKNWLKYKDYHYVTWKGHFTIKELYDIELQPKHRHHRSATIRNIRKIYGFTVADLAWKVELCEYENRSHGVAVEQSRKRRLYVYYY